MAIVLCIIALFLVFLLMRKSADKELEQEKHKKEIEKLEKLRNYPILNENFSKVKSICNRLINIYGKDDVFVQDINYKFRITKETANTISARGIISKYNLLEVSFVFPHDENYITLYLNLRTTYTQEIFANTDKKFNGYKSEDFIIDFINEFVENNSKK